MKTNEVIEKYFEEISSIENNLSKIIEGIKLTYPKPINSKKERKKFFKALKKKEKYNPQLEYEKREYPFYILGELRSLQAKIILKNDYYGLKKLIKDKITKYIDLIMCYSNWGNRKCIKYSNKIYGEPSFFLLLHAKNYCNKFKREIVKYKKITPKKLADELHFEVKRLTGKRVNIEFESLANKVNISPSNNLIKINHEEKFTTLDLKRLKVHEIGVHYMRYFNAQKLSNTQILQHGTSKYIETEEGLAVYTEEIKGVSSKAQMYIYCGRVIATYYASSMSFYNLYNYLKSFGFKDSDAYALTLRAKRNLNDTSQKGSYTKDHCYLKGYLKVKYFAKKNDITPLFFGKFHLDDYKLLKPYIDIKRDDIITIFD